MGRRNDHSRAELDALLVAHGHALLAEVGYSAFSARAAAARAGYSVGTIYNVFGSLDAYLLHINARTVRRWAGLIGDALCDRQGDRLAVLVTAYFDFAQTEPALWNALYAHRLPPGIAVPDWYQAEVGRLTGTMRDEVGRVVPGLDAARTAALARSLLAVVHGHCVFALDGTFDQLDERAPLDAALARVREAIAVAISVTLG